MQRISRLVRRVRKSQGVSVRRKISILIISAMVGSFGILSTGGPASAAYNGGTCPNTGTLNGWMCFWRVSPRTGDNGAYNFADANFTGEFYPLSGNSVNDRNKDNANFSGSTLEICIAANYAGGVQIVLAPNTGQVVVTPKGSSFRPLTNSCAG